MTFNLLTCKFVVWIISGSLISVLSLHVAALQAASETPSGTPTPPTGFFELYQQNRQQHIPNYITEDFLLTAYSLIRQQLGIERETQLLLPQLKTLVSGLAEALAVSASPSPPAAHQETEKKEAEKPKSAQKKDTQSNARSATDPTPANRDFLALLTALLNQQETISDSERAQQELTLILAAEHIAPSPLWGMPLDYSQLKPRGRYTHTPEAAAYFRTVRYAGLVLFAVKASKATGVTEALANRLVMQAKQLTEHVTTQPALQTAYRTFDQTLEWSLGASDDLTLEDVSHVVAAHPKATPSQLRQALLTHAKTHQRQPVILSGIVNKAQLEKGVAVADVLTGWRLLPGRYTPDSAAFQHLVYDAVGVYINDCKTCPPPFGLTVMAGKAVKGFPSSREWMALLGSQVAHQEITASRQTHFEGYPASAQRAATFLKNARGLAAEQILLMKTWLSASDQNVPAGPQHAQAAPTAPTAVPPPSPTDHAHAPTVEAPSFSGERRLNSMLGFWTWQRYIGLLYSKQSYTIAEKSLFKVQDRPGAHLAPALPLYQQLATLVASHQQYEAHPRWDRFAQILATCIQLADKQRQGLSLGADEEAFLNDLDTQLLDLVGVRDEPIVVDVHTEPTTGHVLEQGLGWPRVVTVGSARGGLFTHYEFKYPLAERLTNEAWKTLLSTGNIPSHGLVPAPSTPTP